MDPDDSPGLEAPGRPSPGPEHITPHDRGLVEWVATAAAGDRIPEPWKWASNPFQSVVLRLIDLRVIAAPAHGADRGDVVRGAALAAQAWLERHPRNVERPLQFDDTESPAAPE
ncbi:MAG TPA: hypothetical protein VIJ51_16625 [Solirubrobacteraceae bacterium]